MTSKYHIQSSRRPPLKRVRLDNENQTLCTSSSDRLHKRFCHQSSEDSAFVEIEKSSDERAYDLFHKEYFSQFRPYFKHYSVVLQLIEHLWFNMIESSKVSFVKKKLKEQGYCDESLACYNDTNVYSNDENNSQINSSLSETNRNQSILDHDSKYSRGFVNDLLSYCKHSVTPRFIDKSLSKKTVPLRRSSRIRRAPIKCVCSTCVTTRAHEECSSSTLSIKHDLQLDIFRVLIDHYHQLDDQHADASSTLSIVNNNNPSQFADLSQSQTELVQSIENTEASASIQVSSLSMMPTVSINSDDCLLPSLSDRPLSVSSISEPITAEKIQTVMSNSTPPTSHLSTRRTYVILTELDEPFFGPYPIEFTITI